MSISDFIEQMLTQMLSDSDGIVEIRRNILADQLNCVPSQINYVIKTRFTPERGYVIESRRGGGGSVTIKKVTNLSDNALLQLIQSVGRSLDYPDAAVYISNLHDSGIITDRESKIMLSALADSSITGSLKNEARAIIFKNMLLAIVDHE